MAFQVIVHDRATRDIRQQANYILAKGNQEAAERFLESVEDAFSQLEQLLISVRFYPCFWMI